MRTGVSLFVATIALWLWAETTAQACSCVVPDYNRDYQSSDHVVRVRAIASLPAARGQRTYLALTVGRAFKGCLHEHSLVFVSTRSDGAACGYLLDPGKDYLLYGAEIGNVLGAPVLSINLCGSNSLWSELPDDHDAYLHGRYIQCGEEAGCYQDDGVQCLVDPCDVSRCNVEGAVCNANYCGGCNAEWTDATGALVCRADAEPEPEPEPTPEPAPETEPTETEEGL
jgi:hypothetical protein